MNKRNLMTRAHKIAKSIVATVGDYMVAMKIALKKVWGEVKMANKIIVISESGANVQLINTGGDVKAVVKGVTLNRVQIEKGVLSHFGTVRVGGKPTKVTVNLNDFNSNKAAQFIASVERSIDSHIADINDYAEQSAKIYATA